MGYRYIMAEPPLDYHGEILSGTEINDPLVTILGALYKVMGGAFTALGVGMLLLTVFGVWADLFWPKLTILAMAGVSGWYAMMIPRAVETQTGVQTPWRIAAALLGLAVFGVLLSLL